MVGVALASTVVVLPRIRLCSPHFLRRSASFGNYNFSSRSNIWCGFFYHNHCNPADSDTQQEKLFVEFDPELTSDAFFSTAKETSSFIAPVSSEYPDKKDNPLVVFVSTLVAVGLFLSGPLDFGFHFKDLSAAALPYEEALANGKPTVVEFYADWCKVCRAVKPDVNEIEQLYKDRVNFVMLNINNGKWEKKLDEFGVDFIPHFAFLDRDGNEEGYVEGHLPKQYLFENVDALAREVTLPHSRSVGRHLVAEARQTHQVGNQ